MFQNVSQAITWICAGGLSISFKVGCFGQSDFNTETIIIKL